MMIESFMLNRELEVLRKESKSVGKMLNIDIDFQLMPMRQIRSNRGSSSSTYTRKMMILDPFWRPVEYVISFTHPPRASFLCNSE